MLASEPRAEEIAPYSKAATYTAFHRALAVGIIPATGGKGRSVAEDGAEHAQINVWKAPGVQDYVELNLGSTICEQSDLHFCFSTPWTCSYPGSMK